MEFEAITYAVEDGVATITLNRPDALNAITIPMLEEALDRVEAASEDEAKGASARARPSIRS